MAKAKLPFNLVTAPQSSPPPPVDTASPAVNRSPSREGKKGVTFYAPPEAAKQLKLLAVEQDRAIQDMMIEALDLLFAAYGRHRLARG